MRESQLERDLAVLIKLYCLPEPEREFRFAEPRRWRFDFAWSSRKLAAECEGGTWIQGAHVRGQHYESDARKYNTAAMMGWRVLRFTASMIHSFEAVRMLREALRGR